MNEAETRAELIDHQLRDSGWGVLVGAKNPPLFSSACALTQMATLQKT